jgi:hypothetical protein
MAQATTHFEAKAATGDGIRIAVAAWVLTAVYYFYQYALRSAPAVMMPELSNAFGISPIAVASLVGLFYYGYSPFSLVAGAAMDRIGPRRLLPGAAALVGIGALLFATGNTQIASLGRFLQRNLHRNEKLPTLESRHSDWRYTDVRHGRRISRSVRCWTTDW